MKKLLMFLCCVFAMNVNVAFAVGVCPATFIQFSGTQGPNDNEFLYTTVKAQNSAVDGFVNSKSFNLSGGKVYECDNQQGCMNGSLIFLGDDSHHVFKGDVIKHKIMECSVGFEDRWIAHEWTECPDSKINETYKIKFINTTDADCHAVGPYDYCCFTGDHKACLDAQKRGEPANWTQSGTCNCGDRHVWNPKTGHCEAKNDGGQAGCPNQDEKKACLDKPNEAAWNEKTCKCACKDSSKSWDGKKCVKKDNNHNCGPDAEWKDGACQCKDPKKRWENGRCVDKTTPSCRDSRKTNVGKACCDITYAKYDATTDTCSCKTGEKFELYDTNHGRCINQATPSCRDSRKTNIGKACCDITYANYDAEKDTCSCKAGEKFELYDTNHGRCVEDNTVHVIYQCPMDMFSDWRTLYKDCEDVIAALDELELYCVSSARTEEGYTTRYTKLQQLRRACEQKANDRKHRITESTGIISNASKRLDELMANLKVTVWKNAEGNFNTARLASDSIAGVVLGTAGGIITSKLGKKPEFRFKFITEHAQFVKDLFV